MSRSSLFIPSEYARNWANSQNLVESTKIERHIVDPKKALLKEEKKEKRKHKKERHEKSRKSHQRYLKLDDKPEQQYLPSKKIQDESEQLEKSGLTEEHEQPQNLCYLSDGSQSNNKRKRQDKPVVESNVKVVPGKSLRIRFVFRKPKEPEPAHQEERFCSTLRAQCLAQNEKVTQDTQASCAASAKTYDDEENLPSTSQSEEGTAIPIDTRKKKHKRSKESRYNTLFEDWVVPDCSSAELDIDDDEGDWLLSSSRRQEKPRGEAVEMDKHMSMKLTRAGDAPWPKAQFLPEVGIYSLPYTIPF